MLLSSSSISRRQKLNTVDAGPWRSIIDEMIALGRAPQRRRNRELSEEVDDDAGNGASDAKRRRSHTPARVPEYAGASGGRFDRGQEGEPDLADRADGPLPEVAASPQPEPSPSRSSATLRNDLARTRPAMDGVIQPTDASDSMIATRLDRIEGDLALERARHGELVQAVGDLLVAIGNVFQD